MRQRTKRTVFVALLAVAGLTFAALGWLSEPGGLRDAAIRRALAAGSAFGFGGFGAVALALLAHRYDVSGLLREKLPRVARLVGYLREMRTWVFRRQCGASNAWLTDPHTSVAVASEKTPTRPERLRGKVAFILCHFNPVGWVSTRENYLRTLHALRFLGADVFNAEVIFPGQAAPSSSAFLQIHASDKHCLWQKERLLNLLVERLPAEYDKVAWVDSDVLFLNPHLIHDAVRAVEQFPVVQLFSHVLYVDYPGQIYSVSRGVGAGGDSLKTCSRDETGLRCAPGMAYMLRRSIFPLYDRLVVGGGDQMCIDGWMGERTGYFYSRLSPLLQRDLEVWSNDAFLKVGGSIGWVPGQIVHQYHGSLWSRSYSERWDSLEEFHFDPQQDVEVDPSTGLLSFTPRCHPTLQRAIKNYFRERKEDACGAEAAFPLRGARQLLQS